MIGDGGGSWEVGGWYGIYINGCVDRGGRMKVVGYRCVYRGGADWRRQREK